MHVIILLHLVSAGFVSCSPGGTISQYSIKESHFVPQKWTRLGPAPEGHQIDLHIGLKQHRFHELEKHLNEVSDPLHARYGQYLRKAEVEELVKPSNESKDLVHAWLRHNSIQAHQLEYSSARDWILVTLPVNLIENLLDTKYSVYKHEKGYLAVRTPVWSLPRHLHEHITTIQPTNSFFGLVPRKRRVLSVPHAKFELPTYPPELVIGEDAAMTNLCNTTAVTNLCLRAYYGTIRYTPQAVDQNKVGLTDFLGESNNRSDVEIFLANYRPGAENAARSFEVVVINHGNNQQTPNTAEQNERGRDQEGDLDAETILGFTYPTPLTAYTTGGSPPFVADQNTPHDSNEPYLTWLNYMLNATNIPSTISTSYGDDEQTVPPSYATTVCNSFAQLGARGITLLFASGDSGVGGAAKDCITNDGTNTPTFLPSFPPTCPYITAVGATKNFAPEVAALDPPVHFASGGGYSNYFARPAYQAAAVANYTARLGTRFAGLFNASGRAYPDLAAQGQRVVTVWNGQGLLLDGTSASTPTVAGIITLVNDALVAAGRAPLGFVNPLIYGAGGAGFRDILTGSAVGCGVSGFPAAEGWDAVTGWGTPSLWFACAVLNATVDVPKAGAGGDEGREAIAEEERDAALSRAWDWALESQRATE